MLFPCEKSPILLEPSELVLNTLKLNTVGNLRKFSLFANGKKIDNDFHEDGIAVDYQFEVSVHVVYLFMEQALIAHDSE